MRKMQNILFGLAIGCLFFTGCKEKQLIFLEDLDTVAAGDNYVAALQDGNVWIKCDENSGNAEIKDTTWNDAVRLIKNDRAPAGISADGKILAAKGESVEELEAKMQEELIEIGNAMGNVGVNFGIEVEIAKEMMQWDKLHQVYGGYPDFGGFGLCKDGTIIRTEVPYTELSEAEIAEILSWEDIQDMATIYYGSGIAGLSSDGTVKTVHLEDIAWNNMQSIEAGKTMLFGLTKEGTVLHSDAGYEREYSTEEMKDIVFIAAGYNNEENLDVVYGITQNGKVVDRFGEELEGFEDIVEIDVTTMSPTIVIGRKADGSVCVSK